jgi:acyl-CoA synthetase (AMP-forming)/AMP-acid ligase II
LFVIGRMGQSLKVRGRSVYVEDLEALLSSLPDVPAGRLAVVAGVHESSEVVVVLGEGSRADWAESAARAVRGAIGSSVGVRVAVGPPGTIPRTSSGKPRRRLMWERLLAPARSDSKTQVVVDWPAERAAPGASRHLSTDMEGTLT